MPDPDKHFLTAQKNVSRARHQLIMQLARQNFKHAEITPIILSIDWEQEIKWAAEESRDNAAKVEATQAPPKPISVVAKPE